MDYFKGKRFVTKGAINVLGGHILTILWNTLDHFISTNQFERDYLQIFKLQAYMLNHDYYLMIIHEQEQPAYFKTIVTKVKLDEKIDEKIYIISNQDEHGEEYSTMLLASEY